MVSIGISMFSLHFHRVIDWSAANLWLFFGQKIQCIKNAHAAYLAFSFASSKSKVQIRDLNVFVNLNVNLDVDLTLNESFASLL